MSAAPEAPRIRSLLFGPIDDALEHASAPHGPSDEDAHETRKSLKKARAALRVARQTLGEKAYHRENAALRDASRGISVLRDAKVQFDVLASLRDRYARRRPPDELAPLQQRMHAELDRARAELRHREGAARRAVALIRQSRRRIARMSDEVLDDDRVRAALAAIYRRGRKRFRHAAESAEGSVLHEWRKQTKYLANAIALTSNGAARGRGAIAKRAERLADQLGDEHDLAVLAERIVHDEPVLGPLTAARLQRLIKQRRGKLRRKALRLGAKLYKRKPSRALA
jgi:CHAD domain-containing protein